MRRLISASVFLWLFLPAIVVGQEPNSLGAKVRGLKPEEISEVTRKAEAGDVESQLMLGVAYRFGMSVPQNMDEAAKWFQKASDAGNAAAMNDLGLMYQDGLGVPQSDIEAVKRYQMAADAGNAAGQANLGFMYGQGRGIRKDLKQSLAWTAKSAAQGYAVGQMNLGIIYLRGDGTKVDLPQAIAELTKAARQGYVEAQRILGQAWLGVESEEGDVSAFQWLNTAAAQGDPAATSLLRSLREAPSPELKVTNGQELTALRKKAWSADVDAEKRLASIYDAAQVPASAYFWLNVVARNAKVPNELRKKASEKANGMPKTDTITDAQLDEAKDRLSRSHPEKPQKAPKPQV